MNADANPANPANPGNAGELHAPEESATSLHIPSVLLATGLAFWGWQTNNAYAAAGLALTLLLPVFTQLRLDLSVRDQQRISDLTMILYVAVAASLIATEGLRAGVHASLVWLPGVVLPLMLAQTMCIENRVPMSALFRYLRKQKARGEKVRDTRVDLTGPYLAMTLITAGMANQPGHGYFIGVTLIVAASLWRIKPGRVRSAAWLAALGVCVALGFGFQSGLHTLQTVIEDWIIDWQFSVPVADPYRSSTRIGEIGRLKFDDAIVMRVYARGDGKDKPELLHGASYNHYVGTTWLSRQGSLEPLLASGDGTLFVLDPAAPLNSAKRLRISQRAQSGRALLALPLHTSAVNDLVASRVRRNVFGAVQAEMDVPWTFHTALYDTEAPQESAALAPVDKEDLEVPEKERRTLQAVVRQLGLAALPPAQAAQRVSSYLAGFTYTTVRDRPFSDLLPGSESPLAEFLNTTRRGHCEYFATAATLLLRTAGIPARYATGFAVGDWSAWEGAWIVRERHAHAWTRTFIDGRWQDLDTTPAVWYAEEEALAPAMQKIVDLLRWAGFRYSTRDDSETRILAWVVVGLAALILVWKLATEGGLVRLAKRGRGGVAARPGEDSEFFVIETTLAKRVPRGPGESLLDWLPRAASTLDAEARTELRRLTFLHYRYRFDPQGLDAAGRASLATRCGQLLRTLRTAPHA